NRRRSPRRRSSSAACGRVYLCLLTVLSNFTQYVEYFVMFRYGRFSREELHEELAEQDAEGVALAQPPHGYGFIAATIARVQPNSLIDMLTRTAARRRGLRAAHLARASRSRRSPRTQ